MSTVEASKASRFDILDGRKIRELAAVEGELEKELEKAFHELDKDANGTLSRTELRPAFLKMTRLLGLPEPGSVAQLDDLVGVVFARGKSQGTGAEGGDSALSKSEFVECMKGMLLDISKMLQEDPLFVAVFNGVILKEIATNPETLEAVITKAFQHLDKDGSGKLSRSELLPVLKLLSGGEEGLPPPEVLSRMEEGIIAEFGEGGEELTREEFGVLFRDLMLFMGNALDDNPAVYAQEATVLNGYALRKLVGDKEAFAKEADELFSQWDRSKRGQLSKQDVGEGIKRLGMQIGLPPVEAKEAEQIYEELFSAADFDSSGFVDRDEFELLLRALLLSLAAQLEKNPIVIDCKVSGMESLVQGSRLMDGQDLFEALKDDAKINALLNERFDALDEDKNGLLSKAELKPALLRLAQLLGLPPPGNKDQMDKLVNELFRTVVSENDSEEVDRERFVSTTKEILKQIAGSLESDPMVAVALDGSRLLALLQNDTEFGELSKSMFDALDLDKSGQLSMQELKPALQELGVALGIPPAGLQEEGDRIVAAAVEEYGGGKKELTLAEFSVLLRDILTDIAQRLHNSPVVVGQSMKVLNGSRIRKLLANDEEFKVMVEDLFQEWDRSKTGKLSKADLTAGMKKLGMALGLPPPKAKDAERVYQHLFISADMDDSGFVDKKEFMEFMRLVFVQIASELEKNPVVVQATVVAYES